MERKCTLTTCILHIGAPPSAIENISIAERYSDEVIVMFIGTDSDKYDIDSVKECFKPTTKLIEYDIMKTLSFGRAWNYCTSMSTCDYVLWMYGNERLEDEFGSFESAVALMDKSKAASFQGLDAISFSCDEGYSTRLYKNEIMPVCVNDICVKYTAMRAPDVAHMNHIYADSRQIRIAAKYAYDSDLTIRVITDRIRYNLPLTADEWIMYAEVADIDDSFKVSAYRNALECDGISDDMRCSIYMKLASLLSDKDADSLDEAIRYALLSSTYADTQNGEKYKTEVCLLLGKLYGKYNDYISKETSRHWLKMGLTKFGNQEEILSELADSYKSDGYFEEAEETANAILKLNPNSQTAKDIIGVE